MVALYQRYSDDILIACPKNRWKVLHALIEEKLGEHALELQGAKTDIVHLHGGSTPRRSNISATNLVSWTPD